MTKELEEAIIDSKEIIERLNNSKDFIGRLYYKNKPIEDILKTILKALDNSISKEVIEKKKNQMLEEYKELIETNSTKAFIMKCQIEFAEELLEGK